MTEQLYTNIPPLRPCMCGHGDHYQINGRCLTPGCGCAGRTVDKTGASDAEFRARVAAFDAAPTPDEVVVQTVARWLAEHYGEHPVRAIGPWRSDAAALLDLLHVTMPPSPAEEAVTDDWLYNEASGALYGPTDSPHLRRIVATEVEPEFGHLIANTMNRAALASPAPAPQGEEPTCYCGRLGHRLGGPILHKRTEACPR